MTLPAPGYHPYHTTLNFVLSDFLGAGILAHVKRCLWAGAVDEDLAHHLGEDEKKIVFKTPTAGQISIHCIL